MKFLILLIANFGWKGVISLFFPMYFTQTIGHNDLITFRETGRSYNKSIWWKNPHCGMSVNENGIAVKVKM